MSGSLVREPVPPDLIAAELGSETFVRAFRGVEIHVTTAAESPNTMQEIGRIREVEFRAEGGGTGKAVDIDEYDTGDPAFYQLVAWDPDSRELIGMYRFLPGSAARAGDRVLLPTARLFQFSSEFVESYLPYTIELGRSVVNRSAKRAIMGLFAVWSGLGAIVSESPDLRFFFGKYTTYPQFDQHARAALDGFMRAHCPDPEGLVTPLPSLSQESVTVGADAAYSGEYEPDYETLRERMKQYGETIPPLVISYLGLSRSMRCFGTALNPHFGNVLETAIMIDIRDVNDRQRHRFVESYERQNDQWLSWVSA